MKIPYDYCNIDNFGDKLNPLIFKYFTGFDIVKDNNRFAEVIGIGSILDGLLLNDKQASVSKTPLNVFSSGFGFDTVGVLNRCLRIFAVRGKLTLAKLKNLDGIEYFYKDTVLGDGGLLASYLIKEKIKKEYELGIVPHYADQKNEIFQKIKETCGDKAIILDTTIDPIEFLKQLAKCKAVISTAMHPLIACDSLRIPNMWVRISEKTTSRYKFHDYYSAFGIEKEPYDLSKGFSANDIKKIYDNYNISDVQVKDTQNNLITALDDIKKLLISDMDNIKTRHHKHIKTKMIMGFICNFIPFKRTRKILRNKY